MRPECVACEKPIHDHQVRLTLWRDAGGGGRHTKSIHVHQTCYQIYERIHSRQASASAYFEEPQLIGTEPTEKKFRDKEAEMNATGLSPKE